MIPVRSCPRVSCLIRHLAPFHNIYGHNSNVSIIDHRKGKFLKMCNREYETLYTLRPASTLQGYRRKVCAKHQKVMENGTSRSLLLYYKMGPIFTRRRMVLTHWGKDDGRWQATR